MNYIGDFAEDSTIRIALTTNNTSGGAVAPSTAFEADDFRIYKNGSATQKTTTNGITCTSPFDSVTGLHTLEIDTSNDTGDSGFWTTGADYWVVAVPDETVASQTVVQVIAAFSIENRLRVKSTDQVSLAANATCTKLTDIEADTQDIQTRLPAALVSGRIDSSVGAYQTGLAPPTATENKNAVWNAATVDHTSTGSFGAAVGALPLAPAIADAVWDEPYSQHTTAGTFGKLMDLLRKANLTIDGTVSNAITPTTLTFSSNVSATTSAYAHAVLLFVSGPLTGENSPIISYNNTNGVFVLEEALTAAPSDGDEFVVIAGSHVHAIADIQSGLATSANIDEIKGAGWSSATDTLEAIRDASGSGGDSIMVTPVVAQTPVRVVGSNIETFIGDLSDIRVGVFSGEDPVDLSGFGDLEICVQTKGGTDLDFVEMADITIDGTDSNYFSWAPSGESVSQVRSGAKWSLRKSSNKQVIAYGAWIVVDAALEDVGS